MWVVRKIRKEGDEEGKEVKQMKREGNEEGGRYG